MLGRATKCLKIISVKPHFVAVFCFVFRGIVIHFLTKKKESAHLRALFLCQHEGRCVCLREGGKHDLVECMRVIWMQQIAWEWSDRERETDLGGILACIVAIWLESSIYSHLEYECPVSPLIEAWLISFIDTSDIALPIWVDVLTVCNWRTKGILYSVFKAPSGYIFEGMTDYKQL